MEMICQQLQKLLLNIKIQDNVSHEAFLFLTITLVQLSLVFWYQILVQIWFYLLNHN